MPIKRVPRFVAEKPVSSGWKALLDTKKNDTRVIGPIQRMLLRSTDDGTRRRDVLHPSEMCKSDWCPRASYYQLSGVPIVEEPPSLWLQKAFDDGHLAHDKWQQWLWSVGVLKGEYLCLVCHYRWQATSPGQCPKCDATRSALKYKEVKVADPEHIIEGRADGELDDGKEPSGIEVKGLALDTPLATPTGWTTMERVQVGDQLFGADGKPCTVTHKSEARRIGTYIVTFDDGTDICCDREHYWKVLSGIRKKKEGVLSIEEIRRTLFSATSRPERQHRVSMPAPLVMSEAVLLVEPYLMGCWLGDGDCGAGSAHITKNQELFDQIVLAGHSVGNPQVDLRTSGCHRRTIHGLITSLKKLGLAGVKSPDRWVPAEYLRSSYAQRLALLQGLMDTDGTWCVGRERAKFGGVRSQALALNVYELLLSLGQHPQYTEYWATGYGKKVKAWYVEWTPDGLVPFRRPSQIQCIKPKLVMSKARRRMIYSVVTGPDVLTACVAVDSSDHTYLCGRQMVPTHNTIGVGTLRFEAPELLERHTVEVDGRKIVDFEGLWSSIKQPFATHRRQGNLYGSIMGWHYMYFIYDCKWNAKFKEFKVKVDRTSVQPLFDSARQIKEALPTHKPLRRPTWATPANKTCTSCPYYNTCWEH